MQGIQSRAITAYGPCFYKVEKRVVIHMLVQRVQNTAREKIVLYLHWCLWLKKVYTSIFFGLELINNETRSLSYRTTKELWHIVDYNIIVMCITGKLCKFWHFCYRTLSSNLQCLMIWYMEPLHKLCWTNYSCVLPK